MAEYIEIGRCCDDCLQVIENGTAAYQGLEPLAAARVKHGITLVEEANGCTLTTGDEQGFSWSPCDVCKGSAAGNRHTLGGLSFA